MQGVQATAKSLTTVCCNAGLDCIAVLTMNLHLGCIKEAFRDKAHHLTKIDFSNPRNSCSVLKLDRVRKREVTKRSNKVVVSCIPSPDETRS